MREIFLCLDGGGKLGKGGAVYARNRSEKICGRDLKKGTEGWKKRDVRKVRKKERQALGKSRDEKEQTKNGGYVPPFLVAGEAGLEPAIY